MLSNEAVYRVPERDGVAQEAVVRGTGSSGNALFVLHSRTWHYQSFQPTVLRGFCRDNDRLELRVTAVLEDEQPTENKHATPLPYEDYRADPVFATTHLNCVNVLASRVPASQSDCLCRA